MVLSTRNPGQPSIMNLPPIEEIQTIQDHTTPTTEQNKSTGMLMSPQERENLKRRCTRLYKMERNKL
jgi:hypothetical protein